MVRKKRPFDDLKCHGISVTQYQVLGVFMSGSRALSWAALESYERNRDGRKSGRGIDDYMEALMLCLNQSLLAFVTRDEFESYQQLLAEEKRRHILNCDTRAFRLFEIDFTHEGYQLLRNIKKERGEWWNVRNLSVANEEWFDCHIAPYRRDLVEYRDDCAKRCKSELSQIRFSEVVPAGPVRFSRFELVAESFQMFSRFEPMPSPSLGNPRVKRRRAFEAVK